MASKKATAQAIKRSRQSVLGLTLSWKDENPLMDTTLPDSITDTRVWHPNATRRLVCMDMWKKYQKWIIESEFTWQIIVKIIYKSNRDNSDKVDVGEFRITCGIRDPQDQRIEQAVENFILESKLANSLIAEEHGIAHKSYGHYLRTEFEAIIVGI